MKQVWCFTLFLSFAIFGPSHLNAGGFYFPKPISSLQTVLEKPAECEIALAVLDNALQNAREVKDTNIIVIARPGDGERSQKLNQSRLEFVKNRFESLGWTNSVFAEGSRVSGFGCLEIYIAGKQFVVLRLKKNAKHFCPSPF